MSLIEKLGGIKTEFEFTSQGEMKTVDQQYITRKLDANGKEALFLEFSSIGNVICSEYRLPMHKLDSSFVHVYFQNEEFDTLYELKIATGEGLEGNSKSDIYLKRTCRQGQNLYHGIDITQVPQLILQNTKRIELKEIIVSEED